LLHNLPNFADQQTLNVWIRYTNPWFVQQVPTQTQVQTQVKPIVYKRNTLNHNKNTMRTITTRNATCKSGPVLSPKHTVCDYGSGLQKPRFAVQLTTISILHCLLLTAAQFLLLLLQHAVKCLHCCHCCCFMVQVPVTLPNVPFERHYKRSRNIPVDRFPLTTTALPRIGFVTANTTQQLVD
jgi:hypothetical protein